ncbi:MULTISPECIES: 3-hydroxyacyl-CoA dehydrogenase NAD-binding domain-containing protein [Paenarthrobacter]|uniref:3-hydroxyacyl-CoA dehydrogenase NAD-binding domain-containing protein n=1 Tax=Paenarthrobacter TaxID=1742992 RepID=UPI00074D4277|nr:3-hydroxyacyl-CoA dehydrogenase NAD-binding domain-containing protein [Paenarthrobacter ureafaciens]AMB40331.1 hypothetical protein AUT26_09005 [Arthrobacter sp. ATCC 21022]RWW91492.1 3-hydroxyacyl-CoA dehydrogenase [Paenarthrobacter ureafaciens]
MESLVSISAPHVAETIVEKSVTETSISYIHHAGFRFALLTLRNPERRPVTMGPASLAVFEAVLQSVDPSQVDAVAVTGDGSVFCAGADLKSMTRATTQRDAEDVAKQGLKALGRLAGLPVPTFAFINGTALGGGLELALHANYRTVAGSAKALGFPEVRLGLVPGWGGIPKTMALLGLDLTARLVVTDALAAKTLTAQQATDIGLVDRRFPEDGFLEASLDFAAAILSGTDPSTAHVDRPTQRRPPAAVVDLTALDTIRRKLDARLHGAAPAPYRALELIAAAASAPRETSGQDAEIRAFGQLLLSHEARASIYAFDLTQSKAKKPTGRPTADPQLVRSVGVVGAGLMASQLALIFARKLRVPVRITDLSPERIDSALTWIGAQVDKLVDGNGLSADDADEIRALITGGTDKSVLADSDVVIEAVFEELELKRAVLAELEPLLRTDALLLTNTSSLSVEAMGARLERPERLLGFHFFNPVAVLPLVEIVTTPHNDEATLATGFELARRLQKTAVLVKDTAGFVVNRLLTRLLDEVLSLIDDGGDPRTVDLALDPLGLPMRPLQLLQFIGPSVQLHICETMNRAYPQRFDVSRSLTALVDAGLPGYLDNDGGISPAAAALLPPARPVDPGAVRTTVLAALAQEVTAMLDENVVTGPGQIDLCMILGANYPFHTGGLTPLLDREAGTSFHPGLRVSAVG